MDIKDTIAGVISQYKKENIGEYNTAIQYIKDTRAKQIDRGKILKGKFFEKHVASIPETLFKMIILKLNDKDQEFFNSKRGLEWFAKTFEEFSI